jgi:hypothetical protein
MMKKSILFVLLAAYAAVLFAGCTSDSGIENTDGPPQLPEDITDAELDALFDSRLSRPALAPDECSGDIICTDYTSQGLLRICYSGNTDAKLKLQVLMGDNNIVYNLHGDGRAEDFPLQYGNGEYTARIMENTEGDEYLAVESKTFSVTLEDENVVYLNSVQNVDWDYDMLPIEQVRYIVVQSLVEAKEQGLRFSCAEDVYHYIIQNIEYDDAKVDALGYDYVPDIEQTYIDGKGICYDYASLLAAMLRSINIPTKLVKGYANSNPTVYHAWNEIYIDGEWLVIDTTQDASLLRSGKSFDLKKDKNNYSIVYEY